MKKEDFDRAIEALGVQGLEVIKFSYELNGGVAAVYGWMGELTWLKWDGLGRGFSFEQPAAMEGCISSANVNYLDYQRDARFDLKFS